MRWTTVVLLGLMFVLSGVAARAAAPDLVVQLDNGHTRTFALDTVTCLEFAADSLRVRLGGDDDESFAVADVATLSFRWLPTGVTGQDLGEALTRISHLLPSQPNPWSPETRIAFVLPRAGEVRLQIYSVDGRLVRTLINDQRPAGRQSVRWDGKDEAGRGAASGVYVYRLEAAGIAESRKLVLVR